MRRIILVVAAAVTLALAASTLAYRAISARAGSPPAAPPNLLVPVATRDLDAGTQLQPSDVGTMEWPGQANPLWAPRASALPGRGVVEKIYKGEPFLEARLAPAGGGAGLSAIIPAGMRAVSVKVDDIVGGAGFVTPGMRVDILSTAALGGSGAAVTKTVLQNIEVAPAANADHGAQGRSPTSPAITLLVTPEQAETLSLAAGQTKLQFVARNPSDATMVATSGISLERMLGVEPLRAQARAVVGPPAPAPSKPAPITVDVFTGTRKNSTVVGMKQGLEGPK
jgi:pilus assembly protein CpaB